MGGHVQLMRPTLAAARRTSTPTRSFAPVAALSAKWPSSAFAAKRATWSLLRYPTPRRGPQGVVRANAEDGATVVTDQHSGYLGLEAEGFRHVRVHHSSGEYAIGADHTNGIESFWAMLKRGHYGIYHYMSPKHLQPLRQRILRFARTRGKLARWVSSKRPSVRMIGKRLTYKGLIHA
jgi:hypothetical protein